MRISEYIRQARIDGPVYQDPDWDPSQKADTENGSGCLLVAGGKILLLQRSKYVTEPLTWGIPGGAIPVNKETGHPKPAWQSAMHETEEELGGLPPGFSRYVDKRKYWKEGYTFTTFVVQLPAEALSWSPHLNWESAGWGWFSKDELPKPLHYGLKWLLSVYDPFVSERQAAAWVRTPHDDIQDAIKRSMSKMRNFKLVKRDSEYARFESLFGPRKEFLRKDDGLVYTRTLASGEKPYK